MDSSSDDGSKNETVAESLTNWSLSSFVKPDPKPVEKLPTQIVPLVKAEPTADFPNYTSVNEVSSAKRKSLTSPKCLSNEQIKQEPAGEYIANYYQFCNNF